MHARLAELEASACGRPLALLCVFTGAGTAAAEWWPAMLDLRGSAPGPDTRASPCPLFQTQGRLLTRDGELSCQYKQSSCRGRKAEIERILLF